MSFVNNKPAGLSHIFVEAELKRMNNVDVGHYSTKITFNTI